MVFIPELTIYKMLMGLIRFSVKDYKDNLTAGTESNSILYYMFKKDESGKDLALDRFNWYDNAIEIFVGRDEDSPRKIDINFGYNLSRNSSPNIHIMLPSESPASSSIGSNEGYEDFEEIGDLLTAPVLTETNSVQYNLLVTSDNSTEVVLIYTFLRHMFLSIKTSLELCGFKNVKFGGSDMMFSADILPSGIAHRNFNISFDFDYSSRELHFTQKGDDFVIQSTFQNS